MKKNILFFISLTVFLFTSCVSRPKFSADDEIALFPPSSYIPEFFNWEELCPGISRVDYKNPEFPIIYHAVKIDLALAGLNIECFPDRAFVQQVTGSDSEEVPQPFIYRGITTKKFAATNNCLVATNLSPFAGKNGAWDLTAKLGSVRQIVGLHVADGLMISQPVSRYAVLAFNKEASSEGEYLWKASISKNQNESIAATSDFAFGGFFVVLENGNVLETFARNHDSRTGFGISDDGHTLYILVVEGENMLKSEGLSYPQCGEIFKAMGCTDALEVDGGGSSELCINGKSVLTYKIFRTQANSLGFTINSQKDLK